MAFRRVLFVAAILAPGISQSAAPPCPLALLGLPVAIVVPPGSLLGVVFAGCAAHAASLVPEEHLRRSRNFLDGLVAVGQCMALPHSAPR